MPSPTGPVTASPKLSRVISTPALASAKTGRTANADHGCSACSMRMSGATASRDRRDTSDMVASLTSSSVSVTSCPSWPAIASLVRARG